MYHQLHPVFMLVESLAPSCQPAYVVRKHQMTLIFCHLGSLRAELAFWAKEHLTAQERLTVREAFAQTLDLSRPLDDAILDGCFTPDGIPAPLRLPAAAYPARASA